MNEQFARVMDRLVNDPRGMIGILGLLRIALHEKNMKEFKEAWERLAEHVAMGDALFEAFPDKN